MADNNNYFLFLIIYMGQYPPENCQGRHLFNQGEVL